MCWAALRSWHAATDSSIYLPLKLELQKTSSTKTISKLCEAIMSIACFGSSDVEMCTVLLLAAAAFSISVVNRNVYALLSSVIKICSGVVVVSSMADGSGSASAGVVVEDVVVEVVEVLDVVEKAVGTPRRLNAR